MGIQPVGAQQLIMGAGGMQVAALQHQDAVGGAHRRQAVGDHQRGSATRQTLQSSRDLTLAFGIQ